MEWCVEAVRGMVRRGEAGSARHVAVVYGGSGHGLVRQDRCVWAWTVWVCCGG